MYKYIHVIHTYVHKLTKKYRTALFTILVKLHSQGSNHRVLLTIIYPSVCLSVYLQVYLSMSTYIYHYLSMYNIATIRIVKCFIKPGVRHPVAGMCLVS